MLPSFLVKRYSCGTFYGGPLFLPPTVAYKIKLKIHFIQGGYFKVEIHHAVA